MELVFVFGLIGLAVVILCAKCVLEFTGYLMDQAIRTVKEIRKEREQERKSDEAQAEGSPN